MPRPSELVRRLFDAEAHHDLDGYRALLADEFTERTEGEITSQRGDDAAYAAARSWALAPSAYRRIDDISEAPGCVTVRYRLDHAVPVGITSRHRPSNFLGYSIYETRDGHIMRAGHFLSEQSEPAGTPTVVAEVASRSEGRSGPPSVDSPPDNYFNNRRSELWKWIAAGSLRPKIVSLTSPDASDR